jgi:uncharacterized protein (DUF433 family)
LEGYDYDYKGQRRHSAPITSLARPGDPADGVLDFEQLLTLQLVNAFRSKGLGLPTIKKAAAKAASHYGVDNAFATKRFRTDGNQVFIDLQTPKRERQLINVLSDQHQFHEIVEPSLFKDVVFVGNDPREWWPLTQTRSVLVSPNLQFGAPHIANTGIRTDVIAEAVKAEGNDAEALSAVAQWFGLNVDQVRDAVEFEGIWLARPTT